MAFPPTVTGSLVSRSWASPDGLQVAEAAAAGGIRDGLALMGGTYKPHRNSTALDRLVHWFDVLPRSRYQSCTWTTRLGHAVPFALVCNTRKRAQF